MADNKVKFLRGTAAEYAASTKDNDVFYYITDTQKLYLGANEVTGVGKAGTGASAEIFNDYTQNKANGNYSHAEGLYTKADGSASHSEGAYTDATGDYSHTEGYRTTASKFFAHAGGDSSSALKRGAFVHGNNVIADKNDYETAFGTFNKSNADTLFSVGNGISTEDRSNAFEITKTTGKLFDKEIATKEDIPTTLPANGGNADTLDGKHANEIANNPNMLINPDFRVNQRGQNEYSTGYTVDRWYISTDKCKAAPESDGIRLTASVALASNTHAFWQNLEFPPAGGEYTLSLNVPEVSGVWSARIRTVNASGDYVDSYYTSYLHTGVNKMSVNLPEGEYISAVSIGFNKGTEAGNSLKLAWIKLENGSLATPFVPPDPATELAKCQRYFIRLKNAFGWIGSGFTNKTLARCVIPLPTTMRISPTVTLNGKIYANTPTSLGVGAIECTTARSDISYMQNAIGVSFDLPEGSTSIEPCFMQFHDSESYIDISAEL